MADTTQENPNEQISPQTTNEEITAQIVAEGIPEDDITPELIESWKNINGNIDLTQIGASATVASRISAIHEAAEQASNDITPESVADTVTTAATEAAGDAVDAAKDAAASAVENIDDKAADYIAEKADSWFKGLFTNIPGSGGFLENFSIGEPIKNFVTKMFATFGAGGFFSGLFNNILGRKETQGEGEGGGVEENEGDSDNQTTQTEENEDQGDAAIEATVTETEIVVTEGNEILSEETKQFAYYKSGAMLIVRLNGIPENHNAGVNDILKGLADIPYSQLSSLTDQQKTELLGTESSDGEVGLRDEILNSITSSHSETLLRIGFSTASLNNIIKPNGQINTKLFPYFGPAEEAGERRLNQILEPGFDWKSLTFSEVSMLYISSIPALRIPVANGVNGPFNDIRGFFSDGENLSDEEIDDSLNIIPRDLLQGFLTGMGDDITKSTYLNSSSEEIATIVFGESVDISPENKNIINQIITVKDYLQGGFVNHPKLNLSDEQRQLFKDNLDYSSVLSLYAILGGIPNIDSINTISLPILLFAVSKVIGSGNGNESYQGSLYIGNYVRETLLSGSGEGLSEDELAVIEIYGRSILDLAVLSHLEGFYKTIGLSSGVTGLSMTELGAGTFAGGFVVKQLGDMQIRRGLANGKLPLLGSFFRKIGYVGMIGGALTGGAGLLLNNSVSGAFGRDVEEALESNDLERVREVLKQHTDSVQEHTSSNGEKYIISAYSGEVPYMVYNGDVFMLNVGGRDFLESGEEIVNNFSWDAIKELAARSAPIGDFNGTVGDIDYTKQSVEGDSIILGEGENTVRIEISSLVTRVNLGNPEVIGESFLNTESISFGNEGQEGYPLEILNENYVLYFQNVGSVGNVFVGDNS